MKTKQAGEETKPYSTIIDENGKQWICGLGVNDQGYLSAQHCWEVPEKLSKVMNNSRKQ